MRNTRGFTLMEVLIAASMLSVVFLGSTAMYLTAIKSFKGMDSKNEEIGATLAMEQMVRRIGLGNEATVTGAGAQIKVRWDYTGYRAPLNTPANVADDRFLKYGVVAGRLRTRTDTTLAADVTAADPEVEPGLRVTSSTPFTAVNNRRVSIALTADIGQPAKTKTVRANVALGAQRL